MEITREVLLIPCENEKLDEKNNEESVMPVYSLGSKVFSPNACCLIGLCLLLSLREGTKNIK